VVASVWGHGLTGSVADKPPVLCSFVATYLQREMLHVYRQTTSLERYENWVVTRRRENASLFPYARVVRLRRHPLRLLRRLVAPPGNRRRPLDAAELRQLDRWCRKKSAEVIHVYFGTEAARCLPFLQGAAAARVVSFHGADLSEKLTPVELEDLRGCVDLFLCRSESLAARLRERGVDPAVIRLNYTGVPLPEKTAKVSRGGPLRLLQASRFIAKKGLDTTLRATALLRREGCEVQLTLAGDGPEMQVLQKLAGELGLGSAVHFPGFLRPTDLERLFLGHDLFLHPSRTTASGDREGIPNALLEAMAHGLPAVATSHSGIPEAVTHGQSGWLIGRSEAPELAAAIRELSASPDLRQRLGAGARQIVNERFSTASCVRALEEAYDEARSLAARRTRSAT